MELKYDKSQNFKERLWFIHRYTTWVKSVPNNEWSQQQATFIDSLYLNGQNYCLSPVDYLNMIDAGKKVKNKRLRLRKVL
jgi:hypothetical protein